MHLRGVFPEGDRKGGGCSVRGRAAVPHVPAPQLTKATVGFQATRQGEGECEVAQTRGKSAWQTRRRVPSHSEPYGRRRRPCRPKHRTSGTSDCRRPRVGENCPPPPPFPDAPPLAARPLFLARFFFRSFCFFWRETVSCELYAVNIPRQRAAFARSASWHPFVSVF